MRQYININGESGLHKVVIASAALHIMFIALISGQTGPNDSKMQSYYVSLVPPPAIETRPEIKAAESKPEKKKEVVKVVPSRKDRVKKRQLTKALPQVKKSVSPAGDIKKERPLSNIRQSDNRVPVTKNKIGIKRNMQKPKPENTDGYKRGDNKAGREAFAPGKGTQDRKPVILRKKDDAMSGTGQIERVSSVPAFEGRNSLQKQGNMIARTSSMDKSNSNGTEGISRVPMYLDKEVIQEKSFMVARRNEPDEAKALTSSGNFKYPDRDVIHDAEIGVSSGAIEKKHISRPDTLKKTVKKNTASKRKGDQILRGAGLKEEKGEYDSDNLPASEISIQGVPLDELTACRMALDEGMLKKKILKIVGENKSCYSPASGKYVFLETGRFTSFDMMISPVSGRVLSDRCEELRNALTCLISTKEK